MTARDWLADDNQAPMPQQKPPRDWLQEPDQETFGQALKQAPVRIAQDLAGGANSFLQNAPGYYEKAKTEVPAFLNPMNALRHPVDRASQSLAGALELGQKINHGPRSAAQYAANRLHLIPQEWANKVPQAVSLDEDIEKYIGQPNNPGDALTRGLIRNGDLLTGGKAITGALPHLTQRGASRTLRRANALAAERDIGALHVNPETIRDAAQFLPADIRRYRDAIHQAENGDYHNLFRLQSEVGQIAGQQAGSWFSPTERIRGRAGLEARGNLLNEIHENLQSMGHHDVSDLLRRGQNEYRRYARFRPYRNAIGLAAGVYAAPKNPLTDLIKKLVTMRP